MSKLKSGKKTLEKLKFDPIQRQVELYERLMLEDAYWCEVRDTIGITVLDKDMVEVKRPRYSAVAHMTVLSGLNKVANDLMRYGYARVDETIPFDVDKIPPLQITLST